MLGSRRIICVLQELQLLLHLPSFQSDCVSLVWLLWKPEALSGLWAKLAGSAVTPWPEARNISQLSSRSGDWHLCDTFPSFPCPQAGHREPPWGSPVPSWGPYQPKPLTISCLYNLIPLLQKHRKSTEAIPQIIPQESLNHLINSYDPFKWRRPDDRALLSACFKV